MKQALVLLFMAISSSLLANDFATSKAEFCENIQDNTYQRGLLETKASRLAFRNQGGLFGGGVCWWHSRFTRNATYLAIFRPDLEKPKTEDAAYKIIHDIRRGREIVIVPGFSNIYEFSAEYSDLIQKQLNAWQRHDGAINQSWIRGLLGKTEVSAKKMKRKMNKLYEQVSQGDIVFQVLQLKGITAHAWLVIDMEKTKTGYELMIIDSNYPVSTNVYKYKEGMTSFRYSGFGKFVPYTASKGELRRLSKISSKFCE